MARAWHSIRPSLCRRAIDTAVVHCGVTPRSLRRPPNRKWRGAAWARTRWAVLGLAGTGVILVAPCLGWRAPHARPVENVSGIETTPTAEVTFAAPRRFAAVMEPTTKLQRLYSVGDMIPDGKG